MKKLLLVLVIAFGLMGVAIWQIHGATRQTGGVYSRNLVALGDSVTAGDGLQATAANDPVGCQRSDLAYPVLAARALKLQLRQIACSGAKVTTGLLQPQNAFGSMQPPQLTAARPYLKDSDVVMTIGVNDVGGLELLAKCAQQTGCLASDQAASYQAALPVMGTNLDKALATIKAAQPHRVILNTYYHLLDKTDTCYAQFGITNDKLITIYSLQDQLNAVLEASAAKAGVTVVKTDFGGHGLCAQEPWIQSLVDKSPLHPNAAGQLHMAEQDEAALR